MQGGDGARAGAGAVGEEGMEEKKEIPAWMKQAVLASLKKKKKSVDRTPDEFYAQHFSPPYVYSYFKVGAHLLYVGAGVKVGRHWAVRSTG